MLSAIKKSILNIAFSGMNRALDRTTSQVLFDNGTHKCISFTSLIKGEGVQANQFLIVNNNRAAVFDPGVT